MHVKQFLRCPVRHDSYLPGQASRGKILSKKQCAHDERLANRLAKSSRVGQAYLDLPWLPLAHEKHDV